MKRWEITDALGRSLLSEAITAQQTQLTIDIANLASSTHSLRLIGKGNQGAQIFTKQ